MLRCQERAPAIMQNSTQLRILSNQLTPAELVRVSLEPLVVIGTLLVSNLLFGIRFQSHHLFLVLILFALTSPGNPPRHASILALAQDILLRWFTTVAILILLGWATQTLRYFDQRATMVWLCAAPLTLFAAHLVMPPLLVRLLASKGLERVAVIAGSNELGRRLAER